MIFADPKRAIKLAGDAFTKGTTGKTGEDIAWVAAQTPFTPEQCQAFCEEARELMIWSFLYNLAA